MILHGYNERVTEVYHLVCRHEDSTADQKHIAATFLAIRQSLKKKEYSAAAEIVTDCESHPSFAPYKQSLAILDEHCIQESFMQRKIQHSSVSNTTLSVTSLSVGGSQSDQYLNGSVVD